MKEIASYSIHVDGKNKILRIMNGNLARSEESFDVVVCSAFKGNYFPVAGTLIHSLLVERGISVVALSEIPALDFRSMGC